VHAATSARVEQSYRSIANLAKLPGADEPKTEILSLVFRWLEYEIDEDWLMIVDNADDPAIFFPSANAAISPVHDQMRSSTALSAYLPQKSRGLILITSRNRDAASRLAGRADHVLKIGKLEKDDARDLLRKKLPNDKSDDEDCNALIRALECLPLAITQAAAYIAMKIPRMTISKYLEYFRRNEANQISLLSKDGGDLRRDPEVPNAVVITWQISFEQIKLQNALAADLLSRMCILDRQGIPRFLIFEDDGDDLEFEDAIGVLIGFSFVSSQEDGDNFEMHPLVQLSTRKWLEMHREIEQRKEEALGLLSLKFPNGEYTNWTICEALEPHAQIILKYHYVPQRCRVERANILHNSAWFALSRGKYGVAKDRIQEAADTREELLGPDDRDTLGSYGLLATVLRSEGRWKEAEELEIKVIETSLKMLGQEHPNTLTSMGNLALTYRNQGRWKEAEELEVKVMETRKKVLGQEHPDTLASMNNLASTYWNQGRWKEAEELEVKVMETRKKVLGQEHPSTLMSMANLAHTWKSQGRDKDAIELLKRAEELLRQVLGSDHYLTIGSTQTLSEWQMVSETDHLQNTDS